MFYVENAEHLRPHCHCLIKCVKVNEIKVSRSDTTPLPGGKKVGLLDALCCTIERPGYFATALVVDGFSWGADNLVSLNGDLHLLQREAAHDVLFPPNCSSESAFCQLVHVNI